MKSHSNVVTTQSSFFDPSLTPQNAEEKGYIYIDDVIYDLIEPSDSIKDILDFVKKFECKFGTPNYDAIDETYFGLYVPSTMLPL